MRSEKCESTASINKQGTAAHTLWLSSRFHVFNTSNPHRSLPLLFLLLTPHSSLLTNLPPRLQASRPCSPASHPPQPVTSTSAM